MLRNATADCAYGVSVKNPTAGATKYLTGITNTEKLV